MNHTEIIFFEEYKKLDNLCRDVLNSEKGVTDYIEEMESTPYQKSSLVSSWERDYKSLKHMRWVRNDIAQGNKGQTRKDSGNGLAWGLVAAIFLWLTICFLLKSIGIF